MTDTKARPKPQSRYTSWHVAKVYRNRLGLPLVVPLPSAGVQYTFRPPQSLYHRNMLWINHASVSASAIAYIKQCPTDLHPSSPVGQHE